ncbi:MAG TPA: phenylalanine--tRNA ligase subunit alpha [Candidatus Saccharimonadales bacterium]|nr:phenylalanine--tRNA ligase subunit alpha [Candidatus Saccharimonadales bacterium]
MSSQELLDQLKEKLTAAESSADLEDIWRDFFGKAGKIKLLSKDLATLSENERRTKGPEIKQTQNQAKTLFESKQAAITAAEKSGTAEGTIEEIGLGKPKVGHLHPLTRTVREMNQLFTRLGFSVVEGPELETDEFCFRRLNVPKDHPARDMQDTIYIKEPDLLLRTQTSSVEARVLEQYEPPFKVVVPGRVYRNEKVNKSNHFIFHHYQGFAVLEKTSLKELFEVLTTLFKFMYGDKVKIRFRNKYYPEVEPGVGPDMECFSCHGVGCPVCKGVGWIEMAGAGMIHPNVLKAAGIDPKKWMGFAFGLGLDRLVMAKYNITDIRTLLGGTLAYKYYQDESFL